jgi:5-carboxymethyl-2-hydroxymuconate isomerase
MPHLVILYTNNLEADLDIAQLCRGLADTMTQVHDENAQPVFPTGGVRVLAYPAAHFAVADGTRDYAFIYLNLRMGRGRSQAVKQTAGEALKKTALAHLQALLSSRHIGITFQIDEGQEVFDSKTSSIHPLFAKS